MGSIDLNLQGHFGLKLTDFRKCELVRAITRQGFDLESPFLHRLCILETFCTLLKMGSIDHDLQGNFCQMFNLPYLRNGLIDWHQTNTLWIDGYQRITWMLKVRIIEFYFKNQLYSYY